MRLSSDKSLKSFAVEDIRDARRKADLHTQAGDALADARLLADLVVGAALASKDDSEMEGALIAVEDDIAAMLTDGASGGTASLARGRLHDVAQRWLDSGRVNVSSHRKPLHSPLEFPEVFASGGFDAIVGNPPFLHGQKITGTLGTSYRQYLVHWLAHARGSGDLVAYFFHRGAALLRDGGELGLLATSTIAEGDTREVGLDQLCDAGFLIHRATRSRPWPGGAAVIIAQVWMRKGAWAGRLELDDQEAKSITSSLRAGTRAAGKPHRLAANAGQSFRGTIVLGMGFTLAPDEAQALIKRDPRNRDVLFPYLTAQDITSHPQQEASRFVINFFDWPLQRAQTYPECFEIVEQHVRPDREKLRGRNAIGTGRANKWWLFASYTKSLYSAIDGLTEVVVLPNTSKHAVPTIVAAEAIFSNSLIVVAGDGWHLGVLSSTMHWWWAVEWASTMKKEVRYSPTDCFETFPLPDVTADVKSGARALHSFRKDLMVEREEGLTSVYNRVNSSREQSDEIDHLRALHCELDHAVSNAYGWSDLDLAHDFYQTEQGVRYTCAPGIGQEILDRLLELNFARYAAELDGGWHGKKRSPGRRRAPASSVSQATMFDYEQ